ncbi:MAG: response regulator [Bacteroidales bacterium]|nr:response regulator [Bacteroidales bacterium]
MSSQVKRNILILNSYHKGSQWTDQVVEGVNVGLSELSDQKEIYTEYIDSKRFNKKNSYFIKLYELYKLKYTDIDFDVIILSDDFALDFMLNYGDSLFGTKPVVFCGINNPHNYPHNFTGVIENIEYIENFELIEQLHPDYSKIYFIVDKTKTGNIIYDRAYNKYLSTNNKYRYEFLRNYSFNELMEKVSGLDEKAIVFLTVFTKDRKGEYFSYKKVITNLKKYTDVPIYGTWDFYLGNGIVGGKIICGYNQGLRAVNIANRIMNGENPRDINLELSTSEFKFDHKELKVQNLYKRKLPEGSAIINNPMHLFVEYKQEIILISIVFILLIVIILILWAYILFRKRKIKEERRYIRSIELNSEKLLMAKEKVEEADRLKTAFLANISHELRTPMNGIIGFSKLITDSKDIDSETQEKYLNIINKSGYILLSLVNDIIDLSKIEARQLKLNYSNFKLEELIDELHSFFIAERDYLGKKDIKLLAEKEYEFKDLVVYSDSNRIRQVLYNLLTNALKFTVKGSINFGYYIEKPNIVFFVKDTGIGLTKTEKEIIFKKFRQADDKTTRRYGGSGIGLTISKGIVENLNGELWVESKKKDENNDISSGSTFYFSVPFIPVKSESTNSENKISINQYKWPGKTILIVEDSIISYQLLTKFLKDSQVSFVHATNGQQAVDFCKSNDQIDLVLMDIQLPILDGLEATNQIKIFKPKLPIIAQTANAMDDDKPKILLAGCDDYISKPINSLELFQKIDAFFKS